MARPIGKLSARAVQTLKRTGRHSDGGGLYFVIGPGDSRRWVFLWKRDGRLRELGLGSFRDVSLARARELASEARTLVAAGGDPIAKKRMKTVEQAIPTFGEIADSYVATKMVEFRNEKHRAQWAMTLRVYAEPLRSLPVDQVSTSDVMDVLRPIWTDKPETASRLRGRVERVLNAATAQGLRSGPNPAAWRNHLENLLPKRMKLTRGHHAAMPYNDVPAFMSRLREAEGMAALALQFTILSAARSGEILGALWSELDLDAKVWTIPAPRMKAGREHRVPLTSAMVDVLAVAAAARRSDYVFPGQKPRLPLSVMALTMVMRRMSADRYTVHGFRSAFRDWAGNETNSPRELAEASLAHTVGDATERAYRRSDALERRRLLMVEWAQFLGC